MFFCLNSGFGVVVFQAGRKIQGSGGKSKTTLWHLKTRNSAWLAGAQYGMTRVLGMNLGILLKEQLFLPTSKRAS